MNLEQVLDILRKDPYIQSNITAWRKLPEKQAEYAPFPEHIDNVLVDVLNKRGIRQLYTHQASAIETLHEGGNAVVVTPTASGKTLCYNLPVVNAMIDDPNSRALYLFPTKALSQDQLAELYEMVRAVGRDIKTYTFAKIFLISDPC